MANGKRQIATDGRLTRVDSKRVLPDGESNPGHGGESAGS